MPGNSPTKQTKLWVILAVVLGVVVMLVWRPGLPSPDLPRPSRVAANGERQSPASADASAAGSNENVDRIVAQAPSAPSARTVWIVDEHNLPAVQADVAWLPITNPGIWHGAPWQDHEQHVRKNGSSGTTDEQGAIYLPMATFALLVARSGNRYGQAVVRFWSQSKRQVVRIAPETKFDIQAVDTNGDPAPGVPIVVSYRNDARDHFVNWNRCPSQLLGISDEVGRLTASQLQALPHWPSATARIAFSAKVMEAEPQFVELDLAGSPSEVRVPCPPFGWAALNITRDRSKPLRVPIAIQRLSCNGPMDLARDHWRWLAPGRMQIGPLALHHTWSITGDISAYWRGPSHPGELVEVKSGEPPSRAKTVRIFGPDGSVLRNEGMNIGSRKSQGRWATTNADGWLNLRHGVVVSPRLAAWGYASAPQHGSIITLKPLIVTSGIARDAATHEVINVYANATPVEDDDLLTFAGHQSGDGTFCVLANNYGRIKLRCFITGYEPRTKEVDSGTQGLEIFLRRKLSLMVQVVTDDFVPTGSLDIRLICERTGEDVGRGLSWTSLADEDYRIEVRFMSGFEPVHIVKALRPTRTDAVAASIDLRGRLAVATFDGPATSLHVHDGSKWSHQTSSRLLLIPPEAKWQAFATQDHGLPVLFPVRAGKNTPIVATAPTLAIQWPGVGVRFDQEDLGVNVYLLRRDEPLLDAIEQQHIDPEDPDDQEELPPATLAEVTATNVSLLESISPHRYADLQQLRWDPPYRGIYLIVPEHDGIPLLDQAIEIPVTGEQLEVTATIAIDTGRLEVSRRRGK